MPPVPHTWLRMPGALRTSSSSCSLALRPGKPDRRCSRCHCCVVAFDPYAALHFKLMLILTLWQFDTMMSVANFQSAVGCRMFAYKGQVQLTVSSCCSDCRQSVSLSDGQAGDTSGVMFFVVVLTVMICQMLKPVTPHTTYKLSPG